jgi:predicted nucleotidyltransferase
MSVRSAQVRDLQPDVIKEVLQRILRVVQPKRMVLFGSAARGQMTPDSDLDLLVIVPGPAHRRTIAQVIYRNLHDVLIPVDIIVATEDDVEMHGQAIGSILRPALQEGKVIYEQQPGA